MLASIHSFVHVAKCVHVPHDIKSGAVFPSHVAADAVLA